jgi:hypothetical protein
LHGQQCAKLQIPVVWQCLDIGFSTSLPTLIVPSQSLMLHERQPIPSTLGKCTRLHSAIPSPLSDLSYHTAQHILHFSTTHTNTPHCANFQLARVECYTTRHPPRLSARPSHTGASQGQQSISCHIGCHCCSSPHLLTVHRNPRTMGQKKYVRRGIYTDCRVLI